MPPAVRKSVNEWLVPALLGLIAVLIGLGGNNLVSSIEGVRNDFSAYRLSTETRLVRLEEAAKVRMKEAK